MMQWKAPKMDNQQQIMNVQEQIEKYITSQPEPKCSDMHAGVAPHHSGSNASM